MINSGKAPADSMAATMVAMSKQTKARERAAGAGLVQRYFYIRNNTADAGLLFLAKSTVY